MCKNYAPRWNTSFSQFSQVGCKKSIITIEGTTIIVSGIKRMNFMIPQNILSASIKALSQVRAAV
jgi:hypothetical protein